MGPLPLFRPYTASSTISNGFPSHTAIFLVSKAGSIACGQDASHAICSLANPQFEEEGLPALLEQNAASHSKSLGHLKSNCKKCKLNLAPSSSRAIEAWPISWVGEGGDLEGEWQRSFSQQISTAGENIVAETTVPANATPGMTTTTTTVFKPKGTTKPAKKKGCCSSEPAVVA